MSKRILVVEDQEDNMRIMNDMLSSAGYEVIKAVTGDEGVAMTYMATPTPRRRHGSPRRLQPRNLQDQGRRHLSEARGRSDRRRVRRVSRETETANERTRIE